jgi:putative nucleotidyltransferase with HDIG domain
MTEPARTPDVFRKSKRPIYLKASLDNPLVQGLIGLSMAAAAVALLAPSLHDGRPLLSRADIGLPAAQDIKVPQDFTFTLTDEVATKEKRDQTAAAVLPVYDYRLEIKDSKLTRIQEAFQGIRAAMAPVEAEFDALKKPKDKAPSLDGAERPKKAGERSGGGRQSAHLEAARLEELHQKLARVKQDVRTQFFDALDETLSDEEHRALAGAGFTRQVEDSLTYLVSSAMDFKIVGTSRQLDHLVRAPGITLRIMRGSTVIDEVMVRSYVDFSTVRQAAEKVAEKARQGLKATDPNLRDVLVGIAVRMVGASCAKNRLETRARREAARAAVGDLVTTTEYKKGQILVASGHIVTEDHLGVYLRAFPSVGATDLAQVSVGLLVLLILLATVFFRYGRRTIRKFAPDRRDLLLLGGWLITMLVMGRTAMTVNRGLAGAFEVLTLDALNYGMFVAAGAMLVRLVINAETALLFAVLEALLMGILFDMSVAHGAVALVAGLVGAEAVGHAKLRMDVLAAGVKAGVAAMLTVMCFSLFEGRLLTLTAPIELVCAFGGGVLAGMLVSAVVPVVESLFGYTTNIKLLELANLNNPLLKDLAIRAPGTFHHSILTGTLCEAGAEEIAANPLLARVGAYHHDVGKAKCPEYFAENQRAGQNPHDKLKPSMSVLILKDHVKDGVRILKEAGYPEPIVDICEQHLGTTKIEYFYKKAVDAAEEAGGPVPDETEFRYPGPRPQTREAALVFLADSVEAAAKSMPDPMPSRLQGMVNKIINRKFTDGQFEECDLTLKDLHLIAAAFTRVLTGIYHHRPQYPDQRVEEASREGGFKAKMPAGNGKRKGGGKERAAEEKGEKKAGDEEDAAAGETEEEAGIRRLGAT